MLPPHNLHIQILVVVVVQRRHAARVAEPEVDCLRGALEGDAGPWDGWLDVGVEGEVFVAEVVVF